jgi:UrcA family protein
MYTMKPVMSARSVLGAAAITCTLCAGNVWAGDHPVTVNIHVSTQGLDLSQPAGAQKFYARLQDAARVVCTHGNRVDLEPAADPKGCYERALGISVAAQTAAN